MPARLVLLVTALFALGGALLAAAHLMRRIGPARRRVDWLKFAVYAALVTGLLGAAALGRWATALVVAALVAGGTCELLQAFRPRAARAPAMAAIIAILLCASVGHVLLGPGREWFARYAFLLLLVASTDAFGQVWGTLLGKRPLCPRLSPSKTREGAAGGLATALAVSLGADFLDPSSGPARRACLGILTSLGASAGDLFFSFLKRRAGVKDFSRFLPGHGGILDRFDSLVLAAPVYHWSRSLLAS